MAKKQLNASTLREVLWDTLNQVKAGKLDAPTADAVASQSREILRSIKIQLAVLGQAKENVTGELIEFAKPSKA